jgi:hypothetical protein
VSEGIELPLEGGLEVPASAPGQTHGLYLYDPEVPLRDKKGWPVYAMRLNDGEAACGSKKPKGGYCESPFRYSNGRCKKHGGKAPKADANGRWVDGRESKFRPKGKLLEDYYRFIEDPELTHHRDAIALVDALAQRTLDEWEEGGTPALWRRLNNMWERFEIAWRARDTSKVRELIAEMTVVLERGVAQAERENQVVRLLEASRRHRDSEVKRKTIESMTFTVEEAAMFYTHLGQVVRRYVLDEELTREEVLDAIEDEMDRIGGSAPGESTPLGDPA